MQIPTDGRQWRLLGIPEWKRDSLGSLLVGRGWMYSISSEGCFLKVYRSCWVWVLLLTVQGLRSKLSGCWRTSGNLVASQNVVYQGWYQCIANCLGSLAFSDPKTRRHPKTICLLVETWSSTPGEGCPVFQAASSSGGPKDHVILPLYTSLWVAGTHSEGFHACRSDSPVKACGCRLAKTLWLKVRCLKLQKNCGKDCPRSARNLVCHWVQLYTWLLQGWYSYQTVSTCTNISPTFDRVASL